MTEEERSEAAITTPAGSISIKSKRVAEFIAVAALFVLGLSSYVLWEHKIDAKASQHELAAIFKEIIATNKNMVDAQREMNCLIALPPDRREQEYQREYGGICRRISR